MNNTANLIKQEISKAYPYRIELHAHTAPISGCSQIKPSEMARIYSEKGFDGIVISNHFLKDNVGKYPLDEAIDWFCSGYEETKKEAEKYGLKVYLGAELRFYESINDYMIYGTDKELLKKCYEYLPKGLKAFREEVDLSRSVIVHCHPFRDNMEPCDPELLDGIETFNLHPGHNSRIQIATRYAKENGFKIRTAGSDFHHPGRGHEAVSALRTKWLPEDSFGIAEILKSTDYVFEVGEDAIVLP